MQHLLINDHSQQLLCFDGLLNLTDKAIAGKIKNLKVDNCCIVNVLTCAFPIETLAVINQH